MTTVFEVLTPASLRRDGDPQRRCTFLIAASSGFPLAGLLFVGAYSAANRGAGYAHELFWAAVVLALCTTAVVLGLAENKRRAAAVLTVSLAVLLSLPKYLRAPGYFNFYDELAHWRAAQDLLEGHRLLAPNSLNKVVADYPGLAALSAATAAATGSPVFAAGNIVILVARACGCLAMFLLAERIVRAPAAALLAAVIFMANPAFMFFDAQFAYESLALPLVTVVLLLAMRVVPSDSAHRTPLLIAALLLAGAVVITHHSSSYLLTALLLATAVVAYVLRRPPSAQLLVLAAVTFAGTVTWLFTVARYTLTYVGPYVRSNLASVPDFLTGSGKPRQLFGGFPLPPLYEQVAGYVAVIVLMMLAAPGFWWLRRARPHRDRVAMWVLALLGSLYFLSLPMVALRGDQTAKRVWEFAFIGLGPACALTLWLMTVRGRVVWRWIAPTLLVIVFVGSGVARSGEHIRFPGPYAPSADPRSMTPDVVAAARWLDTERGPDHRVVGDRTLAAAMGSYGEQVAVTYQEDGRPVWKILEPDTLTDGVAKEVRGSR
ncbi:MAG: hypothetical protein QOD41_2304, partial [Cryptosporangiaceae bacterium]|nr:hypothetical protein [Cryptosporangiaceae bacterium]